MCLLDVVEIRYAPSLRSLASARHANRGEPESLLAVADPEADDLPSLPGAAREALEAADWFATSRVIAGPTATVDEVLAVLDEYDVVHFACHGYADPRDAMGGGLALAGETLTARTLLAHHLTDTRLAVLSACETGVYGTRLADEMLGVPGAFLQAGAAGVVGSLWRVPDVSTRLLMSRFYAAWREDELPPPAALRAAQQWLRDASNADLEAQVDEYTAPAAIGDSAAALCGWRAAKPFAAPVYWGAFTYLGV
jgi:CHAT domain-containing protein